jgi:hypothetical protein
VLAQWLKVKGRIFQSLEPVELCCLNFVLAKGVFVAPRNLPHSNLCKKLVTKTNMSLDKPCVQQALVSYLTKKPLEHSTFDPSQKVGNQKKTASITEAVFIKRLTLCCLREHAFKHPEENN